MKEDKREGRKIIQRRKGTRQNNGGCSCESSIHRSQHVTQACDATPKRGVADYESHQVLVALHRQRQFREYIASFAHHSAREALSLPGRGQSGGGQVAGRDKGDRSHQLRCIYISLRRCSRPGTTPAHSADTNTRYEMRSKCTLHAAHSVISAVFRSLPCV